MSRPEEMVRLANHALTLPKDELYKFVFEMAKWIPDMNLWAFAQDVMDNNKEVES